MHVLCVFSLANNHKNLPSIIECFEEKIKGKLSELGATNIDLKHAGLDYTYVGVSQERKVPQKGMGIHQCIQNTVPYPPDYVIMCDGSGKIPYDRVIDVFEGLVSDSSVKCVMAERQGKNKAISAVRFLIEQWEVFALKQFFNHDNEIRDGQCGLWGFYAKEIDCDGKKIKINLTANGYDIELDLLSEVLEKKLGYIFVPVDLPDTSGATHSSFTFENNLGKLNFLLGKYPQLADCLEKYLNNFETREKSTIDALNEEDKGIWAKYKREVDSLANSRSAQ